MPVIPSIRPRTTPTGKTSGVPEAIQGFLGQVTKIAEERRKQKNLLEQIKARGSESNKRLETLLEAIGTLSEAAPSEPQAPRAPIAPTLDVARPQGRIDVGQPGFAGLLGRQGQAEVGPNRQQGVETVLRAARQSPNLDEFFQRGSVKRVLSALGVSEQEIRQQVGGERQLPERQRQFERKTAQFPGQQQRFQEQTQRRSEAQSVFEAIRFRAPAANTFEDFEQDFTGSSEPLAPTQEAELVRKALAGDEKAIQQLRDSGRF